MISNAESNEFVQVFTSSSCSWNVPNYLLPQRVWASATAGAFFCTWATEEQSPFMRNK